MGAFWLCNRGDSFQKNNVIEAISAALEKNKRTKITIENWENRTPAQNGLSFAVYKTIAEQLTQFDDAEDARAYCKLHYGVPILREENESFKASYDRVLKPLEYVDKLAAIKAFDLPVTRLMTKTQMGKYTETAFREMAKLGVVFA